MKRLLILTAILTLMVGAANSQVLKPVKWQISFKKVSEGVYDIICKATIESGWHLYNTKLPENGPLPTTFNLDEDETKDIELVGEFKATTEAKTEKSEAFNMELKYFEGTVTFVQRVKLKKDKAKLVGYVEYMSCSGGQCIPPAEQQEDDTEQKNSVVVHVFLFFLVDLWGREIKKAVFGRLFLSPFPIDQLERIKNTCISTEFSCSVSSSCCSRLAKRRNHPFKPITRWKFLTRHKH